MIRGDATSAYADMLDRFWREIVYLPPDRFVIYDNLLTRDARVQRHIQWLLHSEHPMTQIDDRVETQGRKARLVVQPLFPEGWRCRFPDRLARPPASQEDAIREAHCLSIYPEWVHIWNESPSNSPYPQWDARGGKRLYGPDYPFLVVLTPVRLADPIDWQLEAIQAPGVEGAIVTSGQDVDTVLFRRLGGPYSLCGVESDADKVVIRESGGRIRSLALVRGTALRYNGQLLVDETEPVSLALDL